MGHIVELRARELPPIPFGDIAGGWREQTLRIGDHEFRMTMPADPDALLDDPAVREANVRDNYMPYWGYLWPASLEMSRELLEQPWPAGTPALELGAGIGLTGVAGYAAGLEVTLSDYDRDAVVLALHNARQNGFHHAKGWVFDWRAPDPARTFPVIFGCEVIYERCNHAPILVLLRVMLDRDGVCWIADPNRHQAEHFLRDAAAAGFVVTSRELPRLAYPGRPAGITHLHTLRHAR